MNSQPLTDLDIGFVGVHELIEKGPGIHEPNPVGLEPRPAQILYPWTQSDRLVLCRFIDPWKGPATIRGRSHPVNNKHLLNAKGVTERTKGRKKTYEEPQREGSTDRLDQTVLVRSGPFWSVDPR